MRLTLLAVGDRLPGWAATACADYLERLPRQAAVVTRTVRPERRAGQPAEVIRRAEAARLCDRMPPGSRVVALDEHGRQVTTRELAQLLAEWLASGRDTILVIGGADGLDDQLLARAELTLALSRLTLPHALARVVLAEQLYRAASLLHHHPYHRE